MNNNSYPLWLAEYVRLGVKTFRIE